MKQGQGLAAAGVTAQGLGQGQGRVLVAAARAGMVVVAAAGLKAVPGMAGVGEEANVVGWFGAQAEAVELLGLGGPAAAGCCWSQGCG